MADQSPTPQSATPACSSSPVQRPSLTPQRLQEKGPHGTLVLNSPYGPSRNATYGWGSLFQPPVSAMLPEHPHIHIGISSLNGVPTIGKSDRSMRSLLARYRKKFNCLEHCYPYHNIADDATWQSWADMVRDSDALRSGPSDTPPISSITAPSHSLPFPAPDAASTAPASSCRMCTVNARRFVFTVKANNVLTHAKQLQMHDSEVQELVQTFFHQRCLRLEPFLGPILVQLPPSFVYSKTNMERLTELYGQLTTEEVLWREVTEASSSSQGSSSCALHPQRRVRIAVEFRSRTWYRQETFDLLRSFRWALVVAHHHDDPTFSSVVDTGAGFLYLRLHGPLGRNVGDYGSLAMKLWAEEIMHYLNSRDNTAEQQKEVFVFLNNSDSHVGGTTSSTVDATCLAEHLRHLLSLGATPSPLRSMQRERLTGTSATQPAPASDLAARRAAVDAETAEASAVLSGDHEDDTEAPSAKRPRTSTQSGANRDKVVIID